MAGNLKFVWLFIAVIIVAGLGGYFIGSNSLTGKPSVNQTPAIEQASQGKVFSAQTAIIKGTVLGIDNKTLRVKNSDNVENDVEMDENIVWITLDEKTKISNSVVIPATDSARLKSSILNRDVLINLKLAGDKFKVISIGGIPTAPTSPSPSVSVNIKK